MCPFRSSFKFDTIALIDSLPADEDPQTGPWLRDMVLLPLADQHGFHVVYYRVENFEELFAAFSEIEKAVCEIGRTPIIHIESHGMPEGLVTADNSVVPWPAIRPHLTAINHATRMNLFAVMSMCHGGHLISQLQPVDRSPVWALVGTGHEIFPCRLQEAFEAFYGELMGARDGRAALYAMNQRHQDGRWDLNIDFAEIWFCRIWQSYLEAKCTPNELQERENAAVAQLMRDTNYDLTRAIHGRVVFAEHLRDFRARFAEFRNTFLMLDKFPENESRFGLRYDDCMAQFSPRPVQS